MNLAVETIRVLRRFKNAILEGPPGTGKTFVVEQIAAEWENQTGRRLGGNGQGRYAITLHPSTTYEEFVEGLRYDDEKQGFVRRDGFLLEIISDAIDHPDQDYLVLVDEINRANIPKVLGDVLLGMESSKRSHHDGSQWTGGESHTPIFREVVFRPGQCVPPWHHELVRQVDRTLGLSTPSPLRVRTCWANHGRRTT